MRAHGSNWAGLAVLFSRQLLNGSQDFFFRFNILIFIYFFKYKTIETHARAFLPLNISAVGSVISDKITVSYHYKKYFNWSGRFKTAIYLMFWPHFLSSKWINKVWVLSISQVVEAALEEANGSKIIYFFGFKKLYFVRISLEH